MENCELCIVAKKELESDVVYEDEQLMAVVHRKPASPGQLLLFPKQHYAIIEQVPDPLLAKMSVLANKLGIAIFEALQAEGTNVIINNGVPAGQTIAHFALHIVPRRENDGLKLIWEPRKVTQDQLDTAYLQIKEETMNLHPSMFGKEEAPFVVEKQKPVKLTEEKENYLLKRLRRIP